MSVTIKNGITPVIKTGTGISSTTLDTVSPGQSMGAYHFVNNKELYEIQRSNNFEFVVTDIDNITRAGMNGDEASYIRNIANAQEILRLSVVSTSIPHFTQGVIEVKRGNSTVKYAGTPTFPSGSLTVNDFIGADTKSVLMAWQNLSYNVRTQKVGLQTQYKKNCQLVEYSPDGQVVRSWNVYGCWVSGIQETEYNMENNQKKTITATIEYDYAEIDTSGLLE